MVATHRSICSTVVWRHIDPLELYATSPVPGPPRQNMPWLEHGLLACPWFNHAFELGFLACPWFNHAFEHGLLACPWFKSCLRIRLSHGSSQHALDYTTRNDAVLALSIWQGVSGRCERASASKGPCWGGWTAWRTCETIVYIGIQSHKSGPTPPRHRTTWLVWSWVGAIKAEFSYPRHVSLNMHVLMYVMAAGDAGHR